MSEVLQNEEQNIFEVVKIPVDYEWVIDMEIIKNFKDEDFKFSTHCYLPGFCGLTYCMALIVEENMVYLDMVFCAENPTPYKLYANLKFTCSFNEFVGLKKGFTGTVKHDIDSIHDERIVLFEKAYADWIAQNNPIFAVNQFNVHAEGYIIVEEIYYDVIKHPSNSLYEWINCESSTEVFIIVTEDKEIKVHKKILQERSKVFARMFESSWKETLENRIEIPEFPFKIVQIAIETLNHEYIPVNKLSKTEHLQLYQFADKYDIDVLKETLKNSIDFLPYTIVEYANLAVEYGFEEFEEWCIDYLILCAKHGYSVAGIDKINEKTEKAFTRKLFVNAKITEPIIWKHKCIN